MNGIGGGNMDGHDDRGHAVAPERLQRPIDLLALEPLPEHGFPALPAEVVDDHRARHRPCRRHRGVVQQEGGCLVTMHTMRISFTSGSDTKDASMKAIRNRPGPPMLRANPCAHATSRFIDALPETATAGRPAPLRPKVVYDA